MKRLSIVLGLVLFLCGFAIAGPGMPHAFEGEIIVGDGTSADGMTLLGYVGGVATGESTIDGNKFDIVIVNYGSSGGITFRIGGEEADEEFSFVSLGVTDTDLTFDTVSAVNDNTCGDNVCDAGECSTCPIDCSINDCSGNGECNVEVGESCSLAPGDCGVCEFCGDGIANNGETCSTCSTDVGACTSSNDGGSSDSGNGSSGGGSSSSSNNDVISVSSTPVVNNDNSNDDLSGLGIQELNAEPNASVEGGGFFSGITGAVTGDMGPVGTTILWIVIILVVLRLIYVLFMRSGKK